MAVIFILTCSVLLQLLAVAFALRLIRISGGRLAWLVLAAAIVLMAVRRMLTLKNALLNYPDHLPNIETELVALVISSLVLGAIIAIRPLFESIRNSEKQLAEQTRRNQVILESSPDGFVITSNDGRIRESNAAFCHIANKTNAELLNQNLFDNLFSSEPKQLEVFNNRLDKEGYDRTELRYVNQDNDAYFLEISSKCVSVDGDAFIYSFIRDISEAQYAKAELYEQKERAQVTLGAIGDGVITTDTDGNVQYMNPVSELLCGMRHVQAHGLHITRVLKLFDEKTSEPITNHVNYCLTTRTNMRITENAVIHSHDGESNHSVEIVVSIIKDSSGDVFGTVLVLHDVTELRGMAKQLTYQAAHDSLTGLINRREFEHRLESCSGPPRRV